MSNFSVFGFLKQLMRPGSDKPPASAWLDKIILDQRGEEIVLTCARIVLIEAQGDHVAFKTADNTYLKPGTISEYERQLDPKMFLRIHRSTIVNIKKIARVSHIAEGCLNFHMSNDKVVSSSETYQDGIDEALPRLG